MNSTSGILYKTLTDDLIQVFKFWSSNSGSKDFAAMLLMVLPNSDFYELTLAFQKSHKTGIKYSYTFENLELVKVSANKTEATVKGIIIMKMAAGEILYKGRFTSNCSRKDPKAAWKLNAIEIEW